MSAAEKIWGTTTPLLVTPLFEMHRLRIKPWHRCSLHIHRFKHNAFYVITGELFIDTALVEGAALERHQMLPSTAYTVAPGVLHQFRTQGLDCDALEMYFTEPLSEDIIRSNIGGSY